MKIFSAAQIRRWDAFTIELEPISSIDLMERAASGCFRSIAEHCSKQKMIRIFCGKGNNGGDGLAIARLLLRQKYPLAVYIVETGSKGSQDFLTNLQRLHEFTSDIHFLQSPEFFPKIDTDDLVIDAMLGTGLNKPLAGIYASLVTHINQSGARVVSIDMPTGLFADASSCGNTVIRATHTLSFQQYKLAFLMPENEKFTGKVQLIQIGLHPGFEQTEPAGSILITPDLLKAILKPRPAFAHKGCFGHAALVCGSMGMMGAAVLSAEACLRSGAGKLNCFIPRCGYHIVQTAVPEAMCVVAGDEHILAAPGIDKFDAVGMGPGIGIYDSHRELLAEIFAGTSLPMVIDADALNIIAQNRQLLQQVPRYSILTPHPKEFERLFGNTNNDFERMELAKQSARKYQVYIILKGRYSLICTPEASCFFNSTGNPGMATAGSGDVLTGMLTGLLASGYDSLDACLLGTYLHGKAGDSAAEELSQEAMIAGDIIKFLGKAFISINNQ